MLASHLLASSAPQLCSIGTFLFESVVSLRRRRFSPLSLSHTHGYTLFGIGIILPNLVPPLIPSCKYLPSFSPYLSSFKSILFIVYLTPFIHLRMSAVADANTNATTANNLGSEFENLTIQNQGKMKAVMECDNAGPGGSSNNGFCAICLDKIDLQETALTKGCEHAYCVMCILRWASYNEHPKCPQCKHPFESLHVHRNLDGSLRDYMFEESICLLLRASWFKPLVVDRRNNMYDQINEMEFFPYEYEDEFFEDEDDDDDDLEEAYLNNSASVRIGNRRWGDNGYVRAGRQEARPVFRPYTQDQGAGSSREPKKKEASSKAAVGRRAKRAMKREAADKAAAAKHQQHLVRMGRK